MAIQDYFLPENLNEATVLMAEHGPSLLVLAGGTIAMPLVNDGISIPEVAMGLRRAGLNNLSRDNGTLTIGATATFRQILELDLPFLQEAAGHIGGWQIRNMGTVGGNLFAPPPAGDFATALLVLDAQLKLVSWSGERTVALEDFYTGFLTNVLEPGELVTEIQAELPTGKTVFVKMGRKAANTPSIVAVAAQLLMDGKTVKEARIALNGASSHPIRAKAAEAVLTGGVLNNDSIDAAAEAAMADSDPISDPIASKWYRRKMVGVQLQRALAEIAG